MPQEASKIADPDSTAEATAEAVAESSKQQDAAESGEESGEESCCWGGVRYAPMLGLGFGLWW